MLWETPTVGPFLSISLSLLWSLSVLVGLLSCCLLVLRLLFVVLLVFFVLAIAWFRSPPSLLCVASLCVPSRGWMRGGFCLFSCVLLKRVSVDGLAQAA